MKNKNLKKSKKMVNKERKRLLKKTKKIQRIGSRKARGIDEEFKIAIRTPLPLSPKEKKKELINLAKKIKRSNRYGFVSLNSIINIIKRIPQEEGIEDISKLILDIQERELMDLFGDKFAQVEDLIILFNKLLFEYASTSAEKIKNNKIKKILEKLVILNDKYIHDTLDDSNLDEINNLIKIANKLINEIYATERKKLDNYMDLYEIMHRDEIDYAEVSTDIFDIDDIELLEGYMEEYMPEYQNDYNN